MNLFDGELWPFIALGAVLAIALLARWLRGAAVEDPHDAATMEDPPFEAAGELEQDEHDVEEQEEEEAEEDDELAPLGVSTDDRLEFLERLGADGAMALLWSPPPEPGQPPAHAFVQHQYPDGTATMPVFTSERKAYAYLHVLGPKAVAQARWFDTMHVDAAFLVEGEFEVVVNPGSSFETALSAQDRDTLADLAGVEEREPDESLPSLGDDMLGGDEAPGHASGEDDAPGHEQVPGDGGDAPPWDR